MERNKFAEMKGIISLGLLAFVFVAHATDNTKNDLQEMKLKGKVHSVRTIPYDAVEKFRKITKGSMRAWFGENSFNTFNEQGNKTEQSAYNIDGIPYSKTTYKYDNKGNRIEWNSYNADGRLSAKSTYKYDNQGNRIEWNSYNADGRLSAKSTYKYDNQGNPIEINDYNEVGRLDVRYTYKYEFDHTGNWIKQIEYKDNKPTQIIEREIVYY